MPRLSLFKLVVVLIVGISACLGCKKEFAPPVVASTDPKSSFEATSTRFIAALKVEMPNNEAQQFAFTFSPSSLDVQKTDSLMSPYVGTIKQPFLVKARLNETDARDAGMKEMFVNYDCTFTFGMTDNKWELRTAKADRSFSAYGQTKTSYVDLTNETDSDIAGRLKRARTASGL